jgi:NADP-reducing hydrogenase subunit HndC
MYGLLDKITKGEGEEGDIEALEKLANTIKTTALCGLGQTAPNPVLSTIKYFRHEYEEHIHDKKCRALVCKDLISYEIDAEKCKACTLCAQKCPVDAIRGQRGVVHVIEQEKCVSCGSCYDVCPFGAVQRLSGEN